MAETISKYFPNLRETLAQIPDERATKQYTMADVVFSAVSMFMFKSESRNNFNEMRRRKGFQAAFRAIFHSKAPHMDTVNGILKKLPPSILEQLQLSLVKTLIGKKFFSPFKLLNKNLCISIDGVHIASFDKETEGTIKKESKNGVKSYSRSCLQAKIITMSGFAIPLMTEWIATEDGATKEDCEQNAFKRLSKRLKEAFPKLKICLIMDGLYSNLPVFNICKSSGWDFSITLRDKSLKGLWHEIYDRVLDCVYPIDSLPSSDKLEGGHLDDDRKIPNHKNGSSVLLPPESRNHMLN